MNRIRSLPCLILILLGIFGCGDQVNSGADASSDIRSFRDSLPEFREPGDSLTDFGEPGDSGPDIRELPETLDSRDPDLVPLPDGDEHDIGYDIPDISELQLQDQDETLQEEVTQEEVQEPWGLLGVPCLEDGECQEGVCLQIPALRVCTLPCGQGCSGGWVCGNKAESDGLCVPPWLDACNPCGEDNPCLDSSVCVPSGEVGGFCRSLCLEETCPQGYKCLDGMCLPDSGDCTCLPENLGETRECLRQNELGQCAGTSQCNQDGWSPCNAALPSFELCDGTDNDCDGEIDESCPDLDQDGLTDLIDPDDDGDGILDEDDNCPLVSNSLQTDTNGDGLGDQCQDDDDGDGLLDQEDNCPLVWNPAQTDMDGDDEGDQCDEDDDGDGWDDSEDCAPLNPLLHPDRPEICDGMDNDCDGVVDEGGLPDQDGDGLCDQVDPDEDGDGLLRGQDNCPGIFNPGQQDLDQDGIGDPCDQDTDGDGDPNFNDCAPMDATIHNGADELCDLIDNNCDGTNNEGFPDDNANGISDCIDTDLDSDDWPAEIDNCPDVHNPLQQDTDGDGLGDACDMDDDNDGDPDITDCAPLDASINENALELWDNIDNNCNGIVDEGFQY